MPWKLSSSPYSRVIDPCRLVWIALSTWQDFTRKLLWRSGIAKSVRGEGGLKHELRRFLMPLWIIKFPIRVEHASWVVRTQKTTFVDRQKKTSYSQPQTSSPGLRCYNCCQHSILSR